MSVMDMTDVMLKIDFVLMGYIYGFNQELQVMWHAYNEIIILTSPMWNTQNIKSESYYVLGE